MTSPIATAALCSALDTPQSPCVIDVRKEGVFRESTQTYRILRSEPQR